MKWAHMLGTTVGERFVLNAVAGSGGMGTVFLARDLLTGDRVALKLLQPHSIQSKDVERFTRESQLLAELQHPGIVKYVAHGQARDGILYLAMEWLEGEDLSQRLARGKLTLSESLLVLERATTALAAAHERGIIHRDIKPNNLYLRGGQLDQVTLLDFGIARRTLAGQSMTRTGVVVGTLDYMAPEQARGQRDITPSADIFALGCVFFECLLGHPPFIGEHIAAVLAKILFEEAPPARLLQPDIPRPVEALLSRMLKKDPRERPQNADALLALLKELATAEPEPQGAGGGAVPRALAHEEQLLFSVVLAVPPSSVEVSGSALMAGDTDDHHLQRKTLCNALLQFGGQSAILADGSLVVTLTQTGSAIDQATQAARCALVVQEHWPEARVGLSTGRGIPNQRFPVGEAIDRAVRLVRSRTTSPGTFASFAAAKAIEGIWLDDVSATLLDSRFVVVQSERGVLLQGERVSVDETRTLLGRPTPCLGREQELSLLQAQLASCIEEPGAHAVLVTAPPGTGKSRLRHEFLRRLNGRLAELEVMFGRGELINNGSSYAVMSSVLRRVCGIVGSEPLEEQQQALLKRLRSRMPAESVQQVAEFLGEICQVPFPAEHSVKLQAARSDPKIMNDQVIYAILTWLRAECAQRPVLMILEDFQWGDQPTARLIDNVLRDLSEQPLLVLVLARPEAVEMFPTLCANRRVHEIRLGPLTKKVSERLAHLYLGPISSTEAVARISEQAAGNALYLEELVRAVAEGKGDVLPESVLAMIQSRVSRLDSSHRRILRAASIFGNTFWSGGVRELLGDAENSESIDRVLSELETMEILEHHRESRFPGEDEYAFRHCLLRDAAYSLLVDQDRRLGHQIVAAYLERLGANDAVVLAEHYRMGEQKKSALPFYVRAAQQAYERYDVTGTLNRTRQAEECGAQGETLGALRLLRFLAHFSRNEWDVGFPLGLDGLSLVPVGSYWWCTAMQSLFVIGANINQPEQFQNLVSMFAAAKPLPEAHSPYLVAASWLAVMFSLLGEREQARMFLDRLEQASEVVGKQDVIARCSLHHGHAWFTRMLRPQPWQALGHARESVNAFEQAEDLRNLVIGRLLFGMACLELGDSEDGEVALRNSLATAVRLREWFLVTNAKLYLAIVLCERGSTEQLAEAKALATQVAAENLSPNYTGFAHAVLGQVLRKQGALTEALASSQQAVAMLAMMRPYQLYAYVSLIRVLMEQGRGSEAQAVSADALQVLEQLGCAGCVEVGLRLTIAEAHHAAGNFPAAQLALTEAVKQLYRRADSIPNPTVRTRYLEQVVDNVRLRDLAARWLVVG